MAKRLVIKVVSATQPEFIEVTANADMLVVPTMESAKRCRDDAEELFGYDDVIVVQTQLAKGRIGNG